VTPNPQRVRELLARGRRVPKFPIGARVREPHGDVGVVDKVFADLEAAFDAHFSGFEAVKPDDWYLAQSIPPRTLKTGIWYGVILDDGSVLVGEDDLVDLGVS